MSKSFRNSIEEITRKQMENCAGVFVISSDNYSPVSLIQAGRLYQRTKYLCFEQGIGLHPLSQLIEEEPWKESISRKLGTEYPVQCILRTGTLNRELPDFTTDALTSASIRMDPGQFLTE